MNDTKEWLSRGRRIEQEIEALESARRETYDRLTRMVVATDGVRAKGTKDPHAFDAYAAFENQINRRVEKLVSIKTEIVSAVNKVKDARYRTLLIDRYVRGMTWEQIAVEMHYSYYHVVSELHPAALKAVEPFVKKQK